MIPVVHVALVDARQAITVWTGAYRGIWHQPEPGQPLVHVFTHAADDEIEAAGWTRPETQEA
ncbi:hypothetical protein Ait01nite_031960 [Actinoplanes italicus]|uniref:Uncharacterized protein n=1 Tax=Actinoplanes italicus TaxID=113567 RepID=A0A2T0KJE1_9ACTN|nr:hypothetical protein [Actinoplanes italicus]PRX23650.1 hypothetical protein CLV67_103399 [Actinoplanes italicus]GIE30151.1 hypothetical protein Ait01nite_031960 [Actinoplanes italicus]